MKHTRSPWRIEWTYDDCGKSSVISGDSTHLYEAICIIPHDDVTDESEPEIKANVALILAAPELLEACKMALSYLPTRDGEIYMSDPDEKIQLQIANQLKAAIAKAEIFA